MSFWQFLSIIPICETEKSKPSKQSNENFTAHCFLILTKYAGCDHVPTTEAPWCAVSSGHLIRSCELANVIIAIFIFRLRIRFFYSCLTRIVLDAELCEFYVRSCKVPPGPPSDKDSAQKWRKQKVNPLFWLSICARALAWKAYQSRFEHCEFSLVRINPRNNDKKVKKECCKKWRIFVLSCVVVASTGDRIERKKNLMRSEGRWLYLTN